MLKDFKSFLLKGDIVNLATAVIIGGAFGKIVTSFTEDILMPPIGLLLGDVNFQDLKYVLKEAVLGADGTPVSAEVAIGYGNLIQTLLDFVIIGFCIFMVVRLYEKQKRKEEEAATGPTQEELLSEIRDLLKSKEAPAKD